MNADQGRQLVELNLGLKCVTAVGKSWERLSSRAGVLNMCDLHVFLQYTAVRYKCTNKRINTGKPQEQCDRRDVFLKFEHKYIIYNEIGCFAFFNKIYINAAILV